MRCLLCVLPIRLNLEERDRFATLCMIWWRIINNLTLTGNAYIELIDPPLVQVGMMLRGVGFQNNTPIFLAAGRIYRASENMAPLREMFPFLQTKETLLSAEELEPFKVKKMYH